MSVGAKVKAYSPQLMREYPLAVEGEDGREVSLAGPALRRAPLILVELCDTCLEQVRAADAMHTHCIPLFLPEHTLLPSTIPHPDPLCSGHGPLPPPCHVTAPTTRR